METVGDGPEHTAVESSASLSITGGGVTVGAGGVAAASDGEGSRVLTARGTEDGLVLRVDGRADWSDILAEFEAFLGSRRRFLEGGQVSVEWLERLPTKEQSGELELHLQKEYGITISGRRRRPAFTTLTVGKDVPKGKKSESIPLFETLVEELELGGRDGSSLIELKGGVEPAQGSPFGGQQQYPAGTNPAGVLDISEDGRGEFQETGTPAAVTAARGSMVNRIAKILGEDLQYEEDANAKIVHGTLRSGQRIETPFSLIVVGDVNPGADLVAGGDIVVLGSLRGTAHAAAYDDDNQKRTIFALSMQPIQLRIGSVISRGSEEAGGHPEIARVENRRIVVEAFRGGAPAKTGFGKRGR